MGEVISINISEKRGTEKYSIDRVKIIENWGLEGRYGQVLKGGEIKTGDEVTVF